MPVPSGHAGRGCVAILLVRAVRHGVLAGLGRGERRGRERRDERSAGDETDETSGVGWRGSTIPAGFAALRARRVRARSSRPAASATTTMNTDAAASGPAAASVIAAAPVETAAAIPTRAAAVTTSVADGAITRPALSASPPQPSAATPATARAGSIAPPAPAASASSTSPAPRAASIGQLRSAAASACMAGPYAVATRPERSNPSATPSSTIALARCRKWSAVFSARMFAAVPARKNPTMPSSR